MSTYKTRYALQRHDGKFFQHPTDADPREWTTDAHSAHQWVDIDAAAAAAFIWNVLKHEEVEVLTLTLNDRNDFVEYLSAAST